MARPDDGPDQVQLAGPPRVPRWLDVLTAWSWRLLIIGLAVYATGIIAAQLRIVLLPVGIALLLATVLIPVRKLFTDRGVPVPLAMLGTVAVFFGTVFFVGWVIVPPLVDEFSGLDTTLETAADDVQEWLIDGPIGLSEDFVVDARERIEEAADSASISEGAVVDGATLAGEVLAGLLLALVVTFFVVKDGPMMQRALLSRFSEPRQVQLRAAGNGAWRALGGYLRGAAALGVVEGVVIGATMFIVGAELALPVAALTFVSAFFPFVGAIAAGIIAVSVTLVTAGTAAAGIVAIVAVVVQQLDNDLLAPVIYGKALQLHPLVVILALTTGAAIAGIAGAFIAVPLVAVAIRAGAAVRSLDEGDLDDPDAARALDGVRPTPDAPDP
ncbi:AI-2E family transporter [Acidimicrobiia bacterium EGI L10123]|uniref:AI-2E family transporter n=1 Tax=Salinilacustrithrix flava TaxID=2957203 RepID=UPI003D7C14A6|nr:AI-2E family transporter [Acidimicrobiia bacterium EGI L10123]